MYIIYFKTEIFILYQADPVVEGVVEELPGQLASFIFETSIAGSYAGKTHLVDALNYRYNNFGICLFLKACIKEFEIGIKSYIFYTHFDICKLYKFLAHNSTLCKL